MLRPIQQIKPFHIFRISSLQKQRCGLHSWKITSIRQYQIMVQPLSNYIIFNALCNNKYLRLSIPNINIIYHMIGIGHDSVFVKVLDLSSMALTLSSPGPDGDILERLQVNLIIRD